VGSVVVGRKPAHSWASAHSVVVGSVSASALVLSTVSTVSIKVSTTGSMVSVSVSSMEF